MADAAKEMIWLVKSGERIIGPYYESALIQKLYDREIVVIDEVAKPGGRWRYLREEPGFKAAVEELWRRNQGLREDTDIATVSTTDATSMTPTATLLEQLVKPPIENVSPSRTPIDLPRPAEYDRPQPAESSALSPRTKPSSAAFLWIGAVVALLVAGYVLSQPRAPAAPSHAPAFDQLSAQALRAERTGRFAEALRLLREAHQIRAQDQNLNFRLATLMVKVEHESVDAKRLVTESLATVQTAAQRELGQNILGLVALSEHDLQEARAQFSGALAANAASAPAQFNLGVTAYEQKRYADAIAAFSKCLQNETTHVLAGFMLARAQLESGKQADAEESLKAIINAGVNAPLRQEALLLYAGLKKGAGTSASDVLAADPFLTDETLVSPLLAAGNMSWKTMQDACEALKTVGGSTGAALQTLCELKSDHKTEASKLIADALAKEPANTTLLVTNATVYLDFGKDEEAKGSLKLAMRGNPSALTLNLMARACSESQDAICEREHWRQLLEREPVSVAAYTGLAKLEYQAGSESEARSWLDKAWRLSSTYIPLLQLQDELEQRKR